MGPLGIPFDGSDILFRNQKSFVSEARHAVWLHHFNPTRLEHLRIVHHLLQTFCELDICLHLHELTLLIQPVFSLPITVLKLS